MLSRIPSCSTRCASAHRAKRLLLIALVGALIAVDGAILAAVPAAAQAPPPPSADHGEIDVVVSCLAGNGRVDVHVFNDDAQLNPGREPKRYTMTVGSLAPRSTVVAFDGSHRFSVTGRPDGPLDVQVGVEVASSDPAEAATPEVRYDQPVTVDCDEDQPVGPVVSVRQSCLAGNGRFDVLLRNEEQVTRDLKFVLSGLAPRERSVRPGESIRVSFTGRPDGNYSVTVTEDVPASRTEVVFLERDLPVACDPVVRMRLEATESTPHDTGAFTQGLVFQDGRLFESTGAVADLTSVRELDPQTGTVLRSRHFGDEFFGEGLAAVGDELWLLSWKEGVVRVLDMNSFALKRTYGYNGEGWGLCFDGTWLVMSNGSDQIVFRDPATFDVVRSISVTNAGQRVSRINELECVNGQIWANIWLSDEILRIDRVTGAVDTVVDGSGLGLPRPADGNAVLNGLAWDRASDTWLATGKLWSALHTVEFVDD